MEKRQSLLAGIERLNRIVRHIEDDNLELSQLDRDTLLQELRGLYAEALQLQPAGQAVAPTVEPAAAEAIAIEPVAEPQIPTVTPTTPIAEENAPASAPSDEEEPAPAQPLLEALEPDNNDIFDNELPEAAIVSEPATAEAVGSIEQPVEPTASDMPSKGAENETASSTVPDADKSNRQQHQSSLFDYLGGNKGDVAATETLGERIGRNNISEFRGESAQHKRVDDLRTVININDKFSFMTDLFHNDMRAYNDFILTLNAIDDRATALARVEQMEQQYGWDKSSLTAKKFYDTFERKFKDR